ncbi:MAG: S46 family peptidase [Bacteroidota bacterium]
MKKIITSVLILLMLGVKVSKADEGMWLPLLLQENYADMKKKGLKLTAEQLYSANNSSMKDAIVWFGGGCTGEVISNQGLVLTNHHCGYDAIAGKSTRKDNILDNGFWAKDKSEEKQIEGLTVAFVKSISDVSAKVMEEVKGMDEKTRTAKLPSIYKKIVDEAIKGTGYEGLVREMYKGNAYYLFILERFTDIRLVGTPPQNIGKFGGETDNWMWPRHTGDFSMFRIYSSKDGKPAKYSEENVPYTPKHSLPINLKGIKSGDYAMIMGFPGRTNRYEFSKGVQIITDKVDPTIVALRDIRLNAWNEQMSKDVDTRLKLSSNKASIANYWKFYRGEYEQLKKNKVFEQKQAEEKAFAKWAADKDEYKNLLADVDKTFDAYRPISQQRTFLNEAILAPTVSALANLASAMEDAVSKGDEKQITGLKEQVMGAMEDLPYESLVVKADKRIFDSILLYYYNNVPKDQQAPLMGEIIAKYNAGNPAAAIKAYTDDVFAHSIFADKKMVEGWVVNPRLSMLHNDIAYKHVKAFKDHYINNYKSKVDAFNESSLALGRLYIKGLMEMNKSRKFYPDANSSLRLTYGTVKPYGKFPLITNLDEVIAKNIKYADQPEQEFAIPERLKELHKAKDYGRYAMKDGKLPVAFLTDNDITGGNSGSPVIDGEGQIIGLAFDGNWEAMSGNIHFDPANKRTICVDIRYVLWLVDKFGQAPHIVAEMNIVQ